MRADHGDWDWRKDYEREFGPLEEPEAGDEPPTGGAPAPIMQTRREPKFVSESLGDHTVVIPEALAARLKPFASKRSITLEKLVLDLLEVELDGDLIDTTLGEDFARATADEADADAAHGSEATNARGSTVDAPASIGRPNGEEQ